MVVQLLALDTLLTLFLRDILPHHEVFDLFFLFLSLEQYFIVTAGICVLFIIATYKKFTPVVWIQCIISTCFTLILVNYVLKYLFARMRPTLLFGDANLYCPSSYGFPSAHAAVAFAGVTVLAAYDKKRAMVYYAIACAIAFSRIYLGCHYLGDVLAGGSIGWLISHIIIKYLTLDRIISLRYAISQKGKK